MDIRNQTIHYDSGPRVYWNEILKAAHMRRGMERVFEVLDPKLGNNPDWSQLKTAYRAARPSNTTKDQSTSSASVLPFVSPEKRAGTDFALPMGGDQIRLTESLRDQAADLLSDIDQLAYAESDARFRTTAIPVRLRIAEIYRMLSRLSDGTSEDESMDFAVLNAVAFVREKLELIQALRDLASERTQTANAITNLEDSLAFVLADLNARGIQASRQRQRGVRATVTGRHPPNYRELA
jgi:hypothetical protein